MNDERKNRIIAIVVTAIVMLLLTIWLSFVLLKAPVPSPHEVRTGGVEFIMVGNIADAYGDAEPMQPEPVEPQPEEKQPEPQKVNDSKEVTNTKAEELTSQDVEKTNVVAKKPKPSKEDIEKKKRDERMKRQFSLGSGSDGDRGNTKGAGTQGSFDGNSAVGAGSGHQGNNSWALPNRNLVGHLQIPKKDRSNDAGVLIVNITVNAKGVVTGARVSTHSTGAAASNNTIRQFVLEAARATRFNEVRGPGSTTGTITYNIMVN